MSPSGAGSRRRRNPLPALFRRRLACGAALALAAFPAAGFAGARPGQQPVDFETARLDRRLPAVRAAGEIRIDGVIGEEEWAGAPVASGFTQGNPDEGAPATFETEIRVLYDDEFLYFAAVAYDDDPDAIIVNDRSRDFSTRFGDLVGITLDTFHDRRNGYMFEFNAAGAKFDGQFANEGREFNRDWDGVWYVEALVTAEGWQAEVAVPFKTLRFQPGDEQTWGLNFLRRVRRLNEDAFWAPIPRFFNFARISYSGTLEGLSGLQSGGWLKLTPFASASGIQTGEEDPEGDADAGLDAKVLVGTSLHLDVTVNTDFSQVEADVQQVNLTQFSLFFPEKRDFFIESSGLFRFGSPSDSRLTNFRADFGQAFNPAVLRSSQSRGDDLYLFFSRRIGLSPDGMPIPVLGGARLTGRAQGFEFGALNIQTGALNPDDAGENFAVGRLRRNLGENSDVGAIFMNRQSGGDSGHFNRSFGADANLRVTPELEINSFWARTAGPEGGGDNDGARVAANYDGRLFQLRGAYTRLQENFNPEMGFAPRTGIRRWLGYFGYHYRPERLQRFLREFNPHFEFNHYSDPERELLSRYANAHLALRFQDGAMFEVGYNHSIEAPQTAFAIHPTTTVLPGRYPYDEWFVMFFADPSRPLSVNFRYDHGGFYSGTRRALNLSGVVRAGGRLTAYVGFSRNRVELVEGEFSANLLTARIAYTFTTNMFLNALIQYNNVTEDWSSNIRFNLIHRPLSDFFLVLNDRRDLMGNRIDRALIAKYTILIDF